MGTPPLRIGVEVDTGPLGKLSAAAEGTRFAARKHLDEGKKHLIESATETVLPISTVGTGFEERIVTYQLTMRGPGGMLIASDRRELSSSQTAKVLSKNDVCKIRVSPDGQFAWAYSGHEIAPIYSKHIMRAFEGREVTSVEDAKKILSDCGVSAIQEWRDGVASGPLGPLDAVIVMASGATKKVFRSVARPITEPEEVMRGLCTTGQTANWAAFLPERFYSSTMPIDELACLAACSVRMAHDFDPLGVDRLDMAIYRDRGSRRFELIDGDACWEKMNTLSQKIDASIRQALRLRRPRYFSPD